MLRWGCATFIARGETLVAPAPSARHRRNLVTDGFHRGTNYEIDHAIRRTLMLLLGRKRRADSSTNAGAKTGSFMMIVKTDARLSATTVCCSDENLPQRRVYSRVDVDIGGQKLPKEQRYDDVADDVGISKRYLDGRFNAEERTTTKC